MLLQREREERKAQERRRSEQESRRSGDINPNISHGDTAQHHGKRPAGTESRSIETKRQDVDGGECNIL
jgi:hypothetical protein